MQLNSLTNKFSILALCTAISACSSSSDISSTSSPTNNIPKETQAQPKSNIQVTPALARQASFENMSGKQFTETTSTSSTLYFGFDSSTLTKAAMDTLEAHAEYLNAKISAYLIIEGHTDSRGTPEYNIALAERRAKKVKTFLMNMGVNETQLTMISYGEEKLAMKGFSNHAHSANRRARLTYK